MNNMILLTVDCLRADHLGYYGYNRETSPNVDELAESATTYEHAYANCPGTRWAFQSLHTGLPTHRIDGLGIPDDFTPLASLVSNAGYATGGFAVNGFVSREYNYDKGFDTFYSVSESAEEKPAITRIGKKVSNTINSNRLNEWILEPVYNALRSTGNTEDYRPSHSDEDTVNQALTFIERQQAIENDFFCWIHFMNAHTPYGYWPSHLEALRGDSSINHTIHPGKEEKITVGQEPPQDVIDTYDACIRRVDEQIGRVLTELDENTTVVLTGDHGEEFGRYNPFHHASLYSSMTQVPVIVRTPSISAGRKDTPVQHLDLPPTVLTAADVPVPNYFEGTPLQKIERPSDEPIFFSLGDNHVAVRQDEWKLIQQNGDTELYQVPHSKKETEPVRQENKAIAQELERVLSTHKEKPTLSEAKSGLSEGREELSGAIEQNLEDLGYI